MQKIGEKKREGGVAALIIILAGTNRHVRFQAEEKPFLIVIPLFSGLIRGTREFIGWEEKYIFTALMTGKFILRKKREGEEEV